MNNEEQNQSTKSQDRLVKIGKEKKIKKLMKKISFTLQVPKLICIQNYFQLSESCIINQSALKDPQRCTQSLVANTFYFKRIGSMLITQDILQLNLKDIISPKLPINYFIDRYKSFGDQQFYSMSLKFQKLAKQMACLSKPKQSIIIPQKQHFQNTLYNCLETVKDKKFICFYYQPSQLGLNLKKFLFSKNLLKDIGLDIEQIRDDYIKYKHIFFEIFGGDFYKKIITSAVTNLGDMMENTRLERVKIQEALKSYIINMKTFIHRRKNINGLIYEEEVMANVRLYKPEVFITIIQICDIDQSKVVRMYPLTKSAVTMKSSENIDIDIQKEQ